ncbi:MAG: hypothetical protein ACR5KV_07785 [Wolbachia sp.]
MDQAKDQLPENLTVMYLNDQLKNVRDVLNDLENEIIFAVLLIFIIMMLSMGTKMAMLAALSIPGSFLIGNWDHSPLLHGNNFEHCCVF